MSEINTEFTVYFDNVEKLETIHKGLAIAYAGDNAASDRYFIDAGIPIWPEGHDAWDLVEYARDNQCLRGMINSGTISFDEKEFLKNLAQAGSKFVLANVYDSQVGGKYVIAYRDNKNSSQSKVLKELEKVNPTIALGVAIDKRKAKISLSLIEQGADPNGRVAGKPFIVLAAENENMTILKCLLEAGADINTQSPINMEDGIDLGFSEFTALHWAIYTDSSRMVNLLLKHGADVNVKDHYGCTPIYHAFIGNNALKHVKSLLKAGANLHINDNYGMTPLHYMLKNYSSSDPDVPSSLEVLKILLDNGADPAAVCSGGGNTLWYASAQQPPEVIEYLNALGITDLQRPEGVYGEDIAQNLATAVQHDDRDYFLSQIEAFDTLSANEKASLLVTATLSNRIALAESMLEHGVSPVAPYYRHTSAKPKTALQTAKLFKRVELLKLFSLYAKDEINSQDNLVNNIQSLFESFIEALIQFNKMQDNYSEVRKFFYIDVLNHFKEDKEAEKHFFEQLSFRAASTPFKIEYTNNYDGTVKCSKCNETNNDLMVLIRIIDGARKIVKVIHN